MKINVHGGHNSIVQGATGFFSEVTEDRNVKNLVISKLQALGHTVYDCTDDSGTSQSKNLNNIVAKCNAHTVDLDVSIHFNASNGQGKGVEVLVYSTGSNSYPYAQNICNSIAELGFKNRGVKVRTDLAVLKKTKSPALLVECCFCDNQEDANLYNAENMANAIVKGITNQTVATAPQPTPQPTPQPAPSKPSGYDDWVARLQAECNAQGFSNQKVDGLKGPNTLAGCPTVKKGARGNITKLIQERLNSVGFSLDCDGIFGSATHNAVVVFQRNRGLTQDGIVGKNTWEYLLSGKKY